MRSPGFSAQCLARSLLVVAIGFAMFQPRARASDAGAKGTEQASPTEPTAKHLRVAVAGSKPFVIREGSTASGLAIDVWKATAESLDISFELKLFPSVSSAIDAVASGDMDLAIGPISITAERAEKVDFTQPYFAASAGIIATAQPSSAWARFKPIFSRAFLIGFLVLIGVLFVVGNLMWLAEHRKNEAMFPRRYSHGIGSGMWFAMATMTTVGYGDKSPKTAAGRAIASLWMLIALFAMSSVTAGLATALTLSQIETAGISDMTSLRKRRTVVVDGTPGEVLAERYRAQVIAAKSKEEALEMVSAGTVDAMIYDYPVLQYYLQEHPELDLAVHESTIQSDNYGFAAARDSELVPRMNIALLHLRERGAMEEISSRWLSGI